jgi:hypothetical protein
MTLPISEIRSEIFKPKSRKKSHRIKKKSLSYPTFKKPLLNCIKIIPFLFSKPQSIDVKFINFILEMINSEKFRAQVSMIWVKSAQKFSAYFSRL